MTQAAVPDRWAVVEQIQRRRTHRTPGSFEFEVADHAVSLALNRNRPVDEFFARNALRDAKSVVLRRQRRQQARFVPLYGRGENGDELALSPEIQGAMAQGGSSFSVTERAFIWGEAYAQLRAALEALNRYAAACLDAWRNGEGEQETAAALGISREYVKKLRRLIRETVATMLSGPEWAQ